MKKIKEKDGKRLENEMRIIAPTLLGVEALVANEIKGLGYSETDIRIEDGQVSLNLSDNPEDLALAVAKLNINLSMAERVEIELFNAHVQDFDQLFEVVKSFNYQRFIPLGSKFYIASGYARKSKLFAISSCQAIIRKAMIASLLHSYHLPTGSVWLEDESVQNLRIQFAIMNDRFSLRIDTSGDSLYKRGYRQNANIAPIRETLAAALVNLVRFEPTNNEIMWDPFCGSGTILIEACRKWLQIAPGLERSFAAERYSFIQSEVFATEKERIRANIDLTPKEKIYFYGTDIDANAIAIAKNNANRAMVADFISFETKDALTIQPETVRMQFDQDFVTIVANPPYGERMMDMKEAHYLMKDLGRNLFTATTIKPKVKCHIISADPELEAGFGFYADKRRKLYNGMLPCQFYQYFKKQSKAFKAQTKQGQHLNKRTNSQTESTHREGDARSSKQPNRSGRPSNLGQDHSKNNLRFTKSKQLGFNKQKPYAKPSGREI